MPLEGGLGEEYRERNCVGVLDLIRCALSASLLKKSYNQPAKLAERVLAPGDGEAVEYHDIGNTFLS